MSAIPAHGKIVIYDTEFTSWEGFLEKGFKDAGRYPEIIQFGAIVLDADDDLVEVGSFTTLVRPKINPVLSDYIQELTRITQNDIDIHGVPFSAALVAFTDFMPEDAEALICYGRDGEILEINCQLNGTQLPPNLPNEIDFNKFLLSKGLLEKPATSSTLPTHFGLTFSGYAHNALDDARAVACVLRELRQQNKL